MTSPELNGGCCIEQQLVGSAAPVIGALRAAGLSLVTAESCTGGLIAAVLSHGKGASDCLHGGFVVYTKANKAKVLGVDRALLDMQGAVNAEVARQMALGALERSAACVALSVTGVLGPDADPDGNPAGLLYFAIAREGSATQTWREEFTNMQPDQVRRAAVLYALEKTYGSLR